MKSLLIILLLSTGLHAQTLIMKRGTGIGVRLPWPTNDTLIQWRYDTVGYYGWNDRQQPMVATSLYIGKSILNPDSVYKAQLQIRADCERKQREIERLAFIREVEESKERDRIERRGYEIDSSGGRIYHHLPKTAKRDPPLSSPIQVCPN